MFFILSTLNCQSSSFSSISYLDHISFNALCPAVPRMELLKERLARLGEEVAYLRQEDKEQDARTGKHTNTNPCYRNRTHWRSYHEDEKESAYTHMASLQRGPESMAVV